VREYDQYGQQVGGGGNGYGNAAAATNSGPTLYLIAFRDHTIRAVVAYWVDGNTLHYVTADHESKQVLLDSVDRDMSRQINAERHVQFSLPSR
jgi:endonuclease YncB( thermonuclease family)